MSALSTGSHPFVFLGTLLCWGLLFEQVHGLHITNGVFGETVRIPCSQEMPPNLIFAKWKYESPDGQSVSLATKSVIKGTPQFDDVPEYAKRLNVSEDYSLILSNAGIKDHDRRFVCMLTNSDNVFEAPAVVKLFKLPSKPEIMNKATFLKAGILKKLGVCTARDSFPEGNITWYKNGTVLSQGDRAVVIDSQTAKDQTSSFYTMTSELQYVASKEDLHSEFYCQVAFFGPDGQNSFRSRKEHFNVHYPTEQVMIEVQPSKAFVEEGDNFTIKCRGDGNPPPQDFEFNTPMGGENEISDNYTVTNVKRDAAGEYSCSLSDDKEKKASVSVEVNYLDMSMIPSGEVTKMAGENLSVSCSHTSNKPVSISWTKDNKKIEAPTFTKLHYHDSGSYVCEVGYTNSEGSRKRKTLILTVEGKPQVKLTKKADQSGSLKIINCSVEGFPKPEVSWLQANSPYFGNLTDEAPYVNGKFSSSIKIAPIENVTISCVAENKLGRVTEMVNVSAINIPEEEEKETDDNSAKVNDQAKLIVGIVVGLLLAALVAGLAYWIYMKRTKKTSKGVEKNLGNCEESRKLEENNHTSQA